MARMNKEIDNIVDGLGDFASIVSLIPGLEGAIAVHLTVKHAVKFMRKKGIIKENISTDIKKDFEEVLKKTLQHTADKIYSSEYKDFLNDTYIRLNQVLAKDIDISKITFDKLYELMKPCMEASITIGKYQITPKHTKEFIDKVNQTFAEELYSYPKYGAYINCINILEVKKILEGFGKRIGIVEKDVDEIKTELKRNAVPVPINLKKAKFSIGISKLIGRENDIKNINKLLDEKVSIVLIDGMGGIGKSELCRTICSQYDANNYKIGWFDFKDSLNETLKTIADDKMLTSPENIDIEIKRVKQYLTSLNKKYLLIFDNITHLTKEEVDFIRKLKCKVLITTRNKYDGLNGIATLYPLELLEKKDCIKLFDHYSNKVHKDEETSDLEEIITRTGRHTLAIELLGKIYNTSLKINSIKSLLKELINNKFDLHNFVKANYDTKSKEFIKHMTKLFDIAGIKFEDQLYILKNLCILPPLPVAGSKILEWFGDEFENDLVELSNSGWLKKEDKNITMHNVICETLQIKLSPSYEECKRLIKVLIEEIPKDKSNPERYNAKFLPQCNAVADYFYTNDFEKDHIAYFYFIVADAYQAKGDYEDALRYFKKSS